MSDAKNFPDLEKQVLSRIGLLGRSIPQPMKGFMELHEAAVHPGALSTAVKELIALGIAIAVHCEGCIACHVHDALKAGATPEQIDEAIAVALMMGGGAATVYGSMAHEALQQFLAQSK